MEGWIDLIGQQIIYRLDFKKTEALRFKIAGLKESQQYISKDFENQKRKMAGITKNNKQLENNNVHLNPRIIRLERQASAEQETRIQLEEY